MRKASGARVVFAQFGPKLTERERKRKGMRNEGGHDGCWINDVCCGPDCIMAEHNGRPRFRYMSGVEVAQEDDKNGKEGT